MNTTQTPIDARPPVGNLTDFVDGCDDNNPLDIEIAVNERGQVIVFYDKPFRVPISWFEFNLDTSRLSFIMDGGEIRDAGLALLPAIAKNMQNSHRILTVLMDDQSGEPQKGDYIPLILHRS